MELVIISTILISLEVQT